MSVDILLTTGSLLDIDPFVGVNGVGVSYAQTPCWSLLRMPVPTCFERADKDALGILCVHEVAIEEKHPEAGGMLYRAACYLQATRKDFYQ